METKKDTNYSPDANPDPITGKPGAHPVGTGVGAAGVGTAATALGAAVGGPVGAAAGAVVGAVAGGLMGKGVAEQIDPTLEDEYWRTQYKSRPYVEKDYDYDNDYAPAYRAGYDGYSSYGTEGNTFEEAEPKLRGHYEKQRGNSRLDWDKAKPATKDAWDRTSSTIQGRRENDDYWRTNYKSRPYIEPNRSYDDYETAYRSGYDSYRLYGLDRGMSYDQAEPEIRSRYERDHHDGLSWDNAKDAIRDSWNRAKSSMSSNNRRS